MLCLQINAYITSVASYRSFFTALCENVHKKMKQNNTQIDINETLEPKNQTYKPDSKVESLPPTAAGLSKCGHLDSSPSICKVILLAYHQLSIPLLVLSFQSSA
jgi:hypothetical protein